MSHPRILDLITQQAKDTKPHNTEKLPEQSAELFESIKIEENYVKSPNHDKTEENLPKSPNPTKK